MDTLAYWEVILLGILYFIIFLGAINSKVAQELRKSDDSFDAEVLPFLISVIVGFICTFLFHGFFFIIIPEYPKTAIILTFGVIAPLIYVFKERILEKFKWMR